MGIMLARKLSFITGRILKLNSKRAKKLRKIARQVFPDVKKLEDLKVIYKETKRHFKGKELPKI